MTELIGYLGLALLLAGIPVQMGRLIGAHRRALLVILLSSLMIVLIPWNGHSLIYFIRGVAGDISVSSFMMILLLYARSLGWNWFKTQRLSWQSGALIVALLVPLYASALGYWKYDLYGWGYQPGLMLIGVGLLLGWAWFRQRELAVAWLIGVCAFALGLCPSMNLWDALIDPFMLFGSIGVILSSAIRALLQKKPVALTTESELRRAA